MKKYRQKVTDPLIGDCWRACMATLLQLPPDVLPNDHSPAWYSIWDRFLGQFGLALSPCIKADGPVWATQPWIASVKSLNYKATHAILMHYGGKVLHDPSNLKRYKTGTYLSSKEVISGQHLEVEDVTKLHLLKEYRDRITAPEKVKL